MTISLSYEEKIAILDLGADENRFSPDFLDEMGRKEPFGRLILPEDVARLAVFLLGADSYPMTGAIIDITGGR